MTGGRVWSRIRNLEIARGFKISTGTRPMSRFRHVLFDGGCRRKVGTEFLVCFSRKLAVFFFFLTYELQVYNLRKKKNDVISVLMGIDHFSLVRMK